MPYFIAYLVAGLLISFVHPELRKILVEIREDKERGFAVMGMILAILMLFMVLLWPFVLVFRGMNLGAQRARPLRGADDLPPGYRKAVP